MLSDVDVWKAAHDNDLWIFDKLILSSKLGYTCGPVGMNVPTPGFYIVRPCVNLLGLGLGAQKVYIKDSTEHLTPGHFWCEWFEGDHISIDYLNHEQILAVQGFKNVDDLSKWKKWKKADVKIPLPSLLETISSNTTYINCEFIDGKLIEIHLRPNPDFVDDRVEYIPVWEGQKTDPPKGYTYISDPDIHGRIGAWVR